jgi:hypothetical protein
VKAILAACAALSFAAVGCSPDHGMSYHIIIDTSLSPTQVEDVMAGGQAWINAVPGLQLDYIVSPCTSYGGWRHTFCVFMDGNTPPEDSTYHVLPSATTDIQHPLMPEDVGHDSATIHMWAGVVGKDTSPYAFYNAFAHELGHALAHRSDHIAQGNLMCAREDGNVQESVQQGDIDYFWSAR